MTAAFDLRAGERAPHRTFQPVRRNSYHMGEREHRIWHPLGKTKKEAWRWRDAVVKAAERFDDLTKDPGAHMGALGLSGIKVLRTLFSYVDLMTGRLEPAIATIAERARLARGTVVRALARLKAHGFLDWLRRTEALDNPGAGPQVTQVTNAYWFALKGRAAGLVKLIMKRWESPPPDDEVARKAHQEAETEAMLDGGSLEDVARFRAGDSPLGDALAGLARSLDKSASSISGQNPDLQG